MNLNDFAREITRREGGKVNLSIAQVKETMRITLTMLSELDPIEAMKVINRYRKE